MNKIFEVRDTKGNTEYFTYRGEDFIKINKSPMIDKKEEQVKKEVEKMACKGKKKK